MEQKRSNESQQQGKSTPPSKCPRCGSSDIKFRYYNNYSHDQARYYCKTCQRAWTEGGVLRDVPFRGKIRNNEATSSRSGNPTTQAPQLSVPTPNQTMFSQGVSQFGSFYYHDEVSCLNAIQFLIQPPVIDQHVNVDNQLGTGGSADVARPQEWNIQSMAMEAQQALPQQNPNHLYNSSLVQPNWPMNHLPHDVMNNFDLSTSNAGLWDNSADNTDDMETDTVNVDQWLNLDDHDSP